MSQDPVCGMAVEDDAPLQSTHETQTFRFCSPTCKARFDKEPDRYAATIARALLRGGRP